MKKYIYCFMILIFSCTLNVNALTYNEIKSRNVCNKFELANAKSDKSLESIKCFDDYNSAKTEMNNTTNDNLVILERSNNITRIIDAKLALVYLDIGEQTTNYYRNPDLTGYITYMNHQSYYGATDGVFLELNYSNHAIKVKTNGIVGWTRDGNYKIIPLNFLGDVSYYQVTSDGLSHFAGKNIETNYTSYGRVIDKKPESISVGKYYSYDGNYFYNNLKDLIIDYKNNNYSHAVNKDNPYYNYYMYLPHRARSNYTADDIDAYLKNTKNLIGSIYGKQYVQRYSNMWATGIFFKSSESLYGGNAILMMSLAINESALGQSRIAIDKNNLFGHAAYDSSAYSSATGYLNPYQSILGHAKSYINCGYANPKDYRYYGSNMGNKSTGMNIMYASDPAWGEKAANYYYLFDKDNGFLDYNYYQLGITTNSSVNVRSEPNLTSSIPFNLKYENVPVIILGEVNGTNVNGSTKWYKIVSDANLTSDRTNVQACSYTNYYNYNSYVYVHSSFIKKINKTSNGKYNSIANSNDLDIKYQEYSSGATYLPKVGLVTKDANLFDTATKSVKNGIIAKKGNLVPVYMEAIVNNKVVAYLIASDYSKNQKAWIDSDSLTISDKDLLKVNITANGDYLNVFKTPGGTVLGSIYDNTYLVIIDKQLYNNDTWLKVYYSVSNQVAWINTNITSSKGSLNYTLDKLNLSPVITASNQTLLLGSDFNPKLNIKAIDSEDGDLTSKIQITKNNVNTKKAGNYEVTYEVVDSKGLKTTKTITVTINDYKQGNPLFVYEKLSHLKETTIEVKGFLGVKGMDNKNLTHIIEFVDSNGKIIYEKTLDKYLDYPYEMSSLDDTKSYNYQGGWFKGQIDLSKNNIKQGDYLIYIRVYNKDTAYTARTYFTNIAFSEMPRRIKASSRGLAFDVDYSVPGSPMVLTIRDNGLLSNETPTSFDPTYNFFNELSLANNKLNITGTSHSAYVSYSKSDKVERKIIFENTATFEQFTYDLGYIDNGPYKVELPVSDNKDKTRAWFKNSIDLSKLAKGNYAIYIKTTSNNKSYYGELVDIAYTDFSKINTDKFKLKRIDSKRLRVELEVK